MILPIINEKSAAIFKLLRKSFTSIPPEDLALLCAYIGVTVIRGKCDANDAEIKKACARIAHFAHINLLTPEEYESLLLSQSKANGTTTQQEQDSVSDANSGRHQLSVDLDSQGPSDSTHARQTVGTQGGLGSVPIAAISRLEGEVLDVELSE